MRPHVVHVGLHDPLETAYGVQWEEGRLLVPFACSNLVFVIAEQERQGLLEHPACSVYKRAYLNIIRAGARNVYTQTLPACSFCLYCEFHLLVSVGAARKNNRRN